MEEVCDEIIYIQRIRRYYLIYQKAQQFRGRTTKIVKTFGVEDNQGNIVTDYRRALRVWGKCVQDLYDLENCPRYIVIEAEEELNEDDKGPTIVKAR